MNFYLLTLIKAAVLAAVLLTALAYLQWIERKLIAHIQVRLGPYRVGPHGLLQPLADVIKLLTKEGFIPAGVSRFTYLLAPFIAVSLALLPFAVIPFGPEIEVRGSRTWLQLTDLNIGVLFLLAVSSMSVYAITLAGWSSNSKYALLGSLRSAAQMISYELPMAVALASGLLLAETLSLRAIVENQQGFYLGFLPRWHVFQLPAPQAIALIIFLIAAFAETNRIPFDLPEAENELVAGYHTEYSSLTFAAFFMAEYANMITASAVTTTVFLGGWLPAIPEQWGGRYVPAVALGLATLVATRRALRPARVRDRKSLPWVAATLAVMTGLFLHPVVQTYLLPLFWFTSKTGAILLLYIWVRGTLPRFRYDQLMRFTWKFLFPVAVAHLFATAALVVAFKR